MSTPVYTTMTPAVQDPLQVLICKAAYYAQTAAEALGGPFTPGMYPSMTPFAQDPLQVLAAKLAYWTQQAAVGAGGAGGVFYTFGNYGAGDAIPVNGSITTQGAWNLDTGHAFVNTAWPNIAAPTWSAH